MYINNTDTTSVNRSDEDILEDIWKAFQKEDTIRSIDLQDVSVAVEDGHVFLSGHVSKDLNYQQMEVNARSITGVLSVHNHLVTDRDLILQVARYLAVDRRLRTLVLPVISSHGWISLGGEVPSRDLQQAAGAAAAQVPTVRGVVLLPQVMGEPEDPPRLAVQPPISARVYTLNGMEGIVTQVIIRPENRLVAHAVVRANQTEEGWQGAHDVVVPVEAMDVINEVEIFLVRDVPGLNSFPAFLAGDFPIAPLTWEPPYPYQVGRVRWPWQEKEHVEKGSPIKNAERLPKEKTGIHK